MSIEYYNNNAEKFINDTKDADMTAMYQLFEKYLEIGGIILDIGCGSGRDSKYFTNKGYEVYAHDGSVAMVEQTRKVIGDHAALAKFDEFDPKKQYGKELTFDGLWACASLLHVDEENMLEVIRRYLMYLRTDGVFFMSFKLREDNHEKDGRNFTNFTKEKLMRMIEEIGLIEIVEYVETMDVREGRSNEGWISAIVRKR